MCPGGAAGLRPPVQADAGADESSSPRQLLGGVVCLRSESSSASGWRCRRWPGPWCGRSIEHVSLPTWLALRARRTGRSSPCTPDPGQTSTPSSPGEPSACPPQQPPRQHRSQAGQNGRDDHVRRFLPVVDAAHVDDAAAGQVAAHERVADEERGSVDDESGQAMHGPSMAAAVVPRVSCGTTWHRRSTRRPCPHACGTDVDVCITCSAGPCAMSPSLALLASAACSASDSSHENDRRFADPDRPSRSTSEACSLPLEQRSGGWFCYES